MCVFSKAQCTVLFNAAYFKIEFGDSGFSCEKWIRRVLKRMSQKF